MNKIGFGRKGQISFSVNACQLMELKAGDKVSLCQDDASPDQWFFFKDEQGFPLKKIAKGGLLIHHLELVQTFMDAWELPKDKSARAAIVPEPVKVRGQNTLYWLLEVKAAATT
ncbi:MAG TPA: hypothetical protein VFE32_17270 [Puia sp.]|nr:hypothetical protein [Puia sp.]